MRYEIFYSDHVAVGQSEAFWSRCPDQDVQAVIVQRDDGSLEKIVAYEHYVWTPGGDIMGSDESLPGHIKFGSLMPRDRFDELVVSLEFFSRVWPPPSLVGQRLGTAGGT